MPYEPKWKFTQDLRSQILLELNNAHAQWNTYASIIAEAYAIAYDEHERALTKVMDRIKAEDDMAYWILALVCVSFAGGLVGGIMAPWVASMTTAAAQRIATTAQGAASQGAQIATQRGIDEARPSYASLRPAVMKPAQLDPHLRKNIGLYVSDIKDSLDIELRAFDYTENLSPQGVADWKKGILSDAFVADAPKRADMPDAAAMSRIIEFGMWIAWANFRDFKYWKLRTDRLENNQVVLYPFLTADLHTLDPIVRRMEALSRADKVTFVVEERESPTRPWPMKKNRLLDINKLRIAGYRGPEKSADGIFLSNIVPVVQNPQLLFPNFANLRPQHVR